MDLTGINLNLLRHGQRLEFFTERLLYSVYGDKL